MKRLVKISLILLSIMCIMTKVYAVSCTLNLQTAKNEFTKNQEFTVDVVISDVQTPEGIIGVGATLQYDKNSLTLVNMKGENSWSTPSLNEANGKLIVDRGSLVNKPETVFKMTFRVNEQSVENPTISLKNITVSGGEEDINVPDISKTITIQGGTVTPDPTPTPDDNNQPENNNGDNANGNQNNNQGNSDEDHNIKANTSNNNKEGDSMKKGILPKAGATNVILIVLGGALIVAIIFYFRMKIINKIVK